MFWNISPPMDGGRKCNGWEKKKLKKTEIKGKEKLGEKGLQKGGKGRTQRSSR